MPETDPLRPSARSAAGAPARPTFHGYFRSSSAYRVRIALGLKGVDVEFLPVHLRRGGGEQNAPDYDRLNPQRLVPTLVIGDHVLTQSLAIIEWLEETRPEPRLLPRDPIQRAKVRAFADAIAMEIHPINNLRVLNYLRDELALTTAQVDAWTRHWIATGLAPLEALLSRTPVPGPFSFGDQPTLADVALIPQLASARRFQVDLSAFPRLLAVEAACEALPAFQDARPDRQPDFEA